MPDDVPIPGTTASLRRLQEQYGIQETFVQNATPTELLEAFQSRWGNAA